MKIGRREGAGDRGRGQTPSRAGSQEPGVLPLTRPVPCVLAMSELLFLHLISEFGSGKDLEPLLPPRTFLFLHDDITVIISECMSPDSFWHTVGAQVF